MPRASKATKGLLGRCLMKAVDQSNFAYKPKTVDACRFVHQENNVAVDTAAKDLNSCIDADSLDDFIHVISMQTKKFEVNRGLKLKTSNNKEIVIDHGLKDKADGTGDATFDVQNNLLIKNLRIPRKPAWTREMTKEELDYRQNYAFVEWRKSLAKIEESNYTIQITPYEKNIEVWKQLWRVIERSDIVVQIVDGRDPLFYRCPDVEAYSKEVNADKLNFLLINKSDLLSDDIRREWSNYFNENKIDHMFFSALLEQQRIDAILAEDNEEGNILSLQNGLKQLPQESEQQTVVLEPQAYLNTPNICDKDTLMSTLKKLVNDVKEKKNERKQQKEKAADGNEQLEDELIFDQLDEATRTKQSNKVKNAIQIGMVGYPNVGKSSVINTLCNKKLVGVGSLPGKTKNFQTHFIEDDLILCDCPGLVFPNAASTRAEMVCNGVMPIDKIKDYLSPADLLCSRIPKIVLEKIYKIKIDVEIPDGAYFLSKYAEVKGYYTGSALPDQAKSAKLILKELVSGKLLFAKLPPTTGENSGIWQSNKIDLQADNILGGLDGEGEEQEEIAENMEALMVNAEEKKLDQMLLVLETQKIGDKIEFDEDDLAMLIMGKRVQGIKLNKQQKRDIKHAALRGEKLDIRKYLDTNQILEYGIKNKSVVPPSL